METSILNSVKKVLNLPADYTVFDQDIIMHINSTFGTLNQLGIGPVNGFMIEDETATWDAFLSDNKKLNSVKSYVCLKVRMLFDPPATSFAITAMEKQITELEWRLNVVRETSLDLGEPVSDGEQEAYTGYWWDLTGLTDFPAEAAVGDLGYDSSTGKVWRNLA